MSEHDMSTNSHTDPSKTTLEEPSAGRIDRAMSGLYAIEELGGNCALVYSSSSDSQYGIDLEDHHCTCYDAIETGAYCKHQLRTIFELGIDPLTLEPI